MFQANTEGEGSSENAGATLTAHLVITSKEKHCRAWRRTIRAGVFISIVLKSTTPRLDVSSSQPYDALPSTPPPTASEQPSRTSSTRSKHIIDINSDNEGEANEEQQLLEEKVDSIVKEKDLHSLREFGGVEAVVSALGSNLNDGKIDKGSKTSAYNAPVHARGFFFFLVKAGNSYTVILLLVSAGLSFGIEIKEQGPQSGWHDGVAIVVALFIIVTFTSVANFRRARKQEKMLWEKRNKMKVKVVRSGKDGLITISNLVVGDIVRLMEGDRVPADGLFVSGDGLVVDEKFNSKIDARQNPFLSSGSKVIAGGGRMIVTSVDANTVFGRVLSIKSFDPNEKTLLEARIGKTDTFIDHLALFISVLIAVVVLINLLRRKHGNNDDVLPELKGNVSVDSLMKSFERIFMKPRGTVSILASCLTVTVIGFQHGMPFVITVSLTYWKKKFEENQAIPQNLSACGTMGIVTVICINATGGLMCNKIEVNKFLIGGKDMLDDEESETGLVVLEAIRRGIGILGFVPEISVSRTDESLISWARSEWDMNMELVGQSFTVLDYRKLSSNKECRGVLMRKNGVDEQVLYCHWKGAASTIIGMCSHYYDSRGESSAMENQKREFEKVVKDMEDMGLTPIAFACIQTEDEVIREDGLHLLALVGLKYTCQKELKLLVGNAKNAGVSIKLVSEDEVSVVKAIACELGIYRPGSNDMAIEGEAFRRLPDRMEKIDLIVAMGNSQSEDKYLMVKSLKDKGHVVGFHGGSTTSDIPALKEADVGITEHYHSTEMAREMSDIVILAKNALASIRGLARLASIRRLARFAYHNIQKFTQIQLTACISGLLIPFVVTICLQDSPLTAIQFLWVNGIMCLLGGFMMLMQLPGQELVANPPANRNQSLTTKIMWRNIVIQVLCQACVLLIFQFIGQVLPGMNKDIQKAMIFNSFCLSQIFNQFNAMSLIQKEVLEAVLVNRCFLVAVSGVMVMQVLVVEFMNSLAGCMRLNWMQWRFCFLLAALSWALDCAVKFIADSLSFKLILV